MVASSRTVGTPCPFALGGSLAVRAALRSEACRGTLASLVHTALLRGGVCGYVDFRGVGAAVTVGRSAAAKATPVGQEVVVIRKFQDPLILLGGTAAPLGS